MSNEVPVIRISCADVHSVDAGRTLWFRLPKVIAGPIPYEDVRLLYPGTLTVVADAFRVEDGSYSSYELFCRILTINGTVSFDLREDYFALGVEHRNRWPRVLPLVVRHIRELTGQEWAAVLGPTRNPSVSNWHADMLRELAELGEILYPAPVPSTTRNGARA